MLNTHTLRALALALLMPALVPAQASDELGRVEVSGRPAMPLRTDVRKTCPNADENLQASLARPVYLEGATGVVKVDFTLKGEQVTEVRSTGGPRIYHRHIRRAVSRMGCHADNGEREQRYTFLISFRSEDEVREGDPQLALITP